MPRDGRPPAFSEWLPRQRNRDDNIGDLARDTARDKHWNEVAGYLPTMFEYLERCGAVEGAMEALAFAWVEWQTEFDKACEEGAPAA